jgi:hypothetical protein
MITLGSSRAPISVPMSRTLPRTTTGRPQYLQRSGRRLEALAESSRRIGSASTASVTAHGKSSTRDAFSARERRRDSRLAVCSSRR